VLLFDRDNEVRLELQDAAHINLLRSSERRDPPDEAGRPQAVAGAADDPLPAPKAKRASVRLGTRLTMRFGVTG